MRECNANVSVNQIKKKVKMNTYLYVYFFQILRAFHQLTVFQIPVDYSACMHEGSG